MVEREVPIHNTISLTDLMWGYYLVEISRYRHLVGDDALIDVERTQDPWGIKKHSVFLRLYSNYIHNVDVAEAWIREWLRQT